jgi:hypothetical protein
MTESGTWEKYTEITRRFPFLGDIGDRVVRDVFGGSAFAMIMNSDCQIGRCGNSFQLDFKSKNLGTVSLVAINGYTSHGENPPTYVVGIVYPDTSTPCWHTLRSPKEFTDEIWNEISKFIPDDVVGIVKLSTKESVEWSDHVLMRTCIMEALTRDCGQDQKCDRWKLYHKALARWNVTHASWKGRTSPNLLFLPALFDLLEQGQVATTPDASTLVELSTVKSVGTLPQELGI